jgi:hypothetical protein
VAEIKEQAMSSTGDEGRAGKSQTKAQPTGSAVDRRGFFRSLGGASALAAATVASPFTADEAQAYDPGADERRARYRETADVKAFYRTNGYETLKK